MAFLMESYADFPSTLLAAISAGFSALKVVIAKMDVLNHFCPIISIGFVHFYGDCKDATASEFGWNR